MKKSKKIKLETILEMVIFIVGLFVVLWLSYSFFEVLFKNVNSPNNISTFNFFKMLQLFNK